jgi:hypothetical protein
MTRGRRSVLPLLAGRAMVAGEAPGLKVVGSRVPEVRRTGRSSPMRLPAAFSRLLDLPAVWVRKVALRARPSRGQRRLAPPEARLPEVLLRDDGARDEQDHHLVWRHLDLGVGRLEVRARPGRLRCREHGVHVGACRSAAMARGLRAISRIWSTRARAHEPGGAVREGAALLEESPCAHAAGAS